jgi:hypothetical protein
MPALDGATGWLNTEPLDPAGLRGSVVLVNFWTLTCINWLRQEPWVRAWSHAYREDGLVVIGAHTPEFAFERDVDRIRHATVERGIDYPVAVDSDYGVWDAFANRYWPALYFVDREGLIYDAHFGEGRYEESEHVLQQLLGVERDLVTVIAAGVEAQADWDDLRTPETYLGAARGDNRGWTLSGDWTISREAITSTQPGDSIGFPFHARDAHVVLNRASEEPIPFRLTLDGDPPGAAHGLDVDETGEGVLDRGRLYQLVREPEAIRDRTLEITFEHPGAEAYVFTFG